MPEQLIHGLNGQAEVTQNGVVIHRRDLRFNIHYRNVGAVILPYDALHSVRFKPCGWFMPGYIRFISNADSFNNIRHNVNNDRSTIMFVKAQEPSFEKVRDEVERHIQRVNLSPQQGRTMGVADELQKLSRLVEKGLLTQEEYARQKERLLGRW